MLPNNKIFVPNKVTRNPTDDTACNDELSSSFACYCHTFNHGSALPVHNKFKYCPMFPLPGNYHNNLSSQNVNIAMNHYNCQLNHPSLLLNANIYHSMHNMAEQSFQQDTNIHPPKKSLIGRKTNIDKAKKALYRLLAGSIVSPDLSLECNLCTTTDRNVNLQSQVITRDVCPTSNTSYNIQNQMR